MTPYDVTDDRPVARAKPVAPQAAPPRRVAGELPVSQQRSWLGVLAAVVVTVLYLALLLSYWSPAHPGVDQNAYLVGARSVLSHGTTALTPAEPYGFVGAMYVHVGGGEGSTHYPKYPAGLSYLYAGAMLAAEAAGADAVAGAHLVSPVSAALGLLGLFVLTRRLAGDLAGLLAMLLLGCGQVYLLLAVNPNSHAAATAGATWGFALVVLWLTSRRPGRSVIFGVAGGLLVGFTLTVRYTEGLLVLPLIVACVGALRWRGRGVFDAALPLLAWSLPAGLLAGYNLLTLGTLTGYDSSGESVGFAWRFFLDNWERAVRQVHDAGLTFFFGAGLVGVVALSFRSWRVGLVLLLWVVPQFLLYVAYYFAPEFPLAYTRFFVSLFPPLLAGAAWLLAAGVLENPRVPRAGGAVAAGLAVALACVVGLTRAAYGNEAGLFGDSTLESAAHRDANLAGLGDALRLVARDGDVVVAPPAGVYADAHHLQLVGDYDFYTADAFTRRAGGWERRMRDRSAGPNPIDPNRLAFLETAYADDVDLKAEARRIVDAAHAAGRQVVLVGEEGTLDRFTRRLDGEYDLVVRTWHVETPRVFPPPVEYAEGEEPNDIWRRVRGRPSDRLQRANLKRYAVALLVPADKRE